MPGLRFNAVTHIKQWPERLRFSLEEHVNDATDFVSLP